MKNFIYITILAVIISACGSSSSELEEKKTAIKALKSKVIEMKVQIKDLEKEIVELDSTYGSAGNNVVLVTAITIKPQSFQHKIEVRGSIESKTNVNVSSQVSGEIKSVLVVEGDKVRKGQVLLVLDNEIIQNNIAELQTSLDLAEVIFQKQKSLWERKIGTEVQFLQAKNNKESLERRLTTTKSQLKQTKIKSPFRGTVDAVGAKTGEMAQPGYSLFRIVNPNDVHINAAVSERYIGRFVKGDKVEVYFPSQDQRIVTKVKSVGQVINSQNRTFEVEVILPKVDFPVRPNQVVVLNMMDYENMNAFKVPTKLIQKDQKGAFVFELITKDGNRIARKVHIRTGSSFNNETEILEGVKLGQLIANKGYRELSEGVVVRLMDGTFQNSVANTVGN